MSDSRLKINKQRADKVLTKEFFEEYYVCKMLSFPEICHFVRQKWDISLDPKSVWARAKKHDISSRSKSEANTVRSACDYSKTYMNEQMIKAVDGFLLGDGGIKPTKTCAAFSCSLQYEEFCNYLMSFFECYQPTVKPYIVKDKRIKSGETKGFLGRTKYHPDIWKQYQRWYPGGKKQIPQDVRLTPLSILLWYLGDGSFRSRDNEIGEITVCTDSFEPNNIKNTLVPGLRRLGICAKLQKDNRLHIYSMNMIPFFKFIGMQCPVKCYKYKFNLDSMLLYYIPILQVASDIGVNRGTIEYRANKFNIPIKKKFGKRWIKLSDCHRVTNRLRSNF